MGTRLAGVLYEFVIKHRTGKHHNNADTRNGSLESVSPSLMAECNLEEKMMAVVAVMEVRVSRSREERTAGQPKYIPGNAEAKLHEHTAKI